jgi:catechol 2,3-dioxygenase-like lactoylglutathione lyase family enzyme
MPSCAHLIMLTMLSRLAAGSSAILTTPENPLGLKPHHITAAVLDLDRAVKWYQDMLGFKLKDRGSRMNGAMQFAELTIPGFGVALVQMGPTVTAAPVAAPPHAAPRWIHMVFSVADPGSLFKQLEARGAAISTRDSPAARMRSFLVQDSEGNEVEIVASEGLQTRQ